MAQEEQGPVLMPRYYPDCTAALKALSDGLNDQVCHNFDGIREVVMCAAWHEHARGVTPKTFGEHVHEAWQQARSVCKPYGGIKPEYGFMRHDETHLHVENTEHTPEGVAIRFSQSDAQPEVFEIDKDGKRVGILSREPDGAIATCLEDHCATMETGGDYAFRNSVLHHIRDLLEIQGYTLHRSA